MINFRDHKIKYAVNKTIAGKMPANATQDKWRRFNSSFRPKEGTAHSLAVDIWRGWSFTPLYKNNRRRKDNFQAAYHIALDFDTMDERSSLDTLVNEPFSMYASFIYSTPSSQPNAPKSRIVFIFDKPIETRDRYELLYRALLEEFPAADKSTKDAARLFYGSPKCELRPIWSIMDTVTIDNIIGMYEMEQDEIKKKKEAMYGGGMVFNLSPNQVSTEYLEKIFGKLSAHVSGAGNGGRHTTLNNIAYTMGGYVAGGYISVGDAENMLKIAVSQMSDPLGDREAQTTIAAGLRDGQAKPITVQKRSSFHANIATI